MSGPVRWWAPGRVNVIGEHTDYNDGFSLPIALRFGVRAELATTGSGRLVMTSAQEDEPVTADLAGLAPGAVDGWAAYLAGAVWATLGWAREHDRGPAADALGGLTVDVDGDVPAGAGLSSSAALQCAVASALADALDLGCERTDLVTISRRSENDFVGAATGALDQSASMLCTAGNALFLDNRDASTRQVPFDLAGAGLALLVVDTRAAHSHVGGEYSARRASCEKAARTLGVRALRDVQLTELDAALDRLPDEESRRRVRHVVTEDARVLQAVRVLDSGADPRELGPLLTASHASLRDDYQVSVPEVDLAVDSALSAGVYGARITGGGFGGSVIALIEADAADRVEAAVRTAYREADFAAPHCFTVQAEDGAHRLD